MPWLEDSQESYEGVYFYGISEYESIVILAIDEACIDFQVIINEEYYLDNGGFGGWQEKFTNYTNVRISGNKFYSNETNGEFVIYETNQGERVKCLKLDTPPNDVYEKYELGQRSDKSKKEFVEGEYVSTKFEIIPEPELLSLNPFDLKVMRNEIFARYGYKFRPGGQMEDYFSKQEWYYTSGINVNDLLTCIERINIKNILEVENILKE